MTHREIEAQMQEALFKLEGEVRADGDNSYEDMHPPTLEGLADGIRQLHIAATLTRQHAERLELHSRHLGDRLRAVKRDDVRELTEIDPDAAARLLYDMRRWGAFGAIILADEAADQMGEFAAALADFTFTRQGLSESDWR